VISTPTVAKNLRKIFEPHFPACLNLVPIHEETITAKWCPCQYSELLIAPDCAECLDFHLDIFVLLFASFLASFCNSNRLSCKDSYGHKNAFWDDFLLMAHKGQLEALIAAVREMGGSGGNIKLREKLGWDGAVYDAVRDQAISAGNLVAGRGRGGSVRLPDGESALPFPADDAGAAEPAKQQQRGKGKKPQGKDSAANVGFEAKLWQAADKLRSNMDAAEYKHVVLGLIFLKYISDAFEEHRAKLVAGEGDYAGADPEEPDEYRAENVFWVPAEARWSHLQANGKQPTIGKLIDDAMVAIERDNARLKGVLPKDYARPALDKQRLGQLIDLVGTIGLGDAANRSKDVLGRVYEYFLTQFASAEGKNGGQFYTPSSVVRTLVQMLEPYKGRVYDPCCGSGGMFVQSEKFVESHGGRIGDIAIYGQESNATTRRLAVMNLAIRGIEADFGPEHADTFVRDIHADLRADFVIANPPFNDSDWMRRDDDVRWKYGLPPKGNANYAWIQHFIHHLAPSGMAGFVLANGSMSSNQSGEGEIRKALVDADLIDCMVALPGQLFYSTQIPVCLWFIAKNKNDGKHRDRRKETLFIDARKMGTLVDRVHRELTDADIAKIADTYHLWKRDFGRILREAEAKGIELSISPPYEDIAGFCKSATTDEIASHGYVLTPGRYVGAEEVEDDGEPFDTKMKRLVGELQTQFAESAKLEAAIQANLRGLGYGG
jgi:type I restriction enzyme M protein